MSTNIIWLKLHDRKLKAFFIRKEKPPCWALIEFWEVKFDMLLNWIYGYYDGARFAYPTINCLSKWAQEKLQRKKMRKYKNLHASVTINIEQNISSKCAATVGTREKRRKRNSRLKKTREKQISHCKFFFFFLSLKWLTTIEKSFSNI